MTVHDTDTPHFQEFFQRVGQCITQWSEIENELFRLCHLSLRCTLRRAAIVYYRTPSIEGRIALTDELINSLLPQRDKKDGGHDHQSVKEWNNIISEIRSLLPKRNMIAHSPIQPVQIDIMMMSDAPFSGRFRKVREEYMVVSYRSKAEIARGKAKQITLSPQDLLNHYTSVKTLVKTLSLFRAEISLKPP
jgi:hypothetical protein